MSSEKTKKYLDDMETRIKDFVIQEDKKNYHKLSELMHTTSPQTKQSIKYLNVSINDIREHQKDIQIQLENHDKRESLYWKKIDNLVNEIKDQKRLLEENIVGIKGVTSLINSSKLLRAFVGYVILPAGAVIGSIYAIKNWILK